MTRKGSPRERPRPAPEPAPASGTSAIAAAVSVVPAGRESLLGFADAVGRLAEAAPAAAPTQELHLVSFQLDREAFGIPITKVREIIRVTDITRVPQAPPHIRGVTNLRGRILPVVELRTRLGLSPAVVSARSRIVVVEAHGRILGILVDAVLRVVKVPATAVAPPPEEIITARTDFITGVAKLQSELLILLDLEAALLVQDSGTAGAPAAQTS